MILGFRGVSLGVCGGLREELDLTRKVGGATYDVLYYGYMSESESREKLVVRDWKYELG